MNLWKKINHLFKQTIEWFDKQRIVFNKIKPNLLLTIISIIAFITASTATAQVDNLIESKQYYDRGQYSAPIEH